ncbi:hypothetical protein KDH_00520 [Dictyobacter sp. S3.2.2.5]|uniref:Transposase n=1 Tax=Dictyobacter halimunensis TaxID=3026934 RepID=A0ABQ6FKZ8_9CHLR|nr:hypothetical protein KDH_00520 [Dictyobacter sp. S3.2.2.5]
MKEWTYEERVEVMPKEQKTFTREFKQEAVQLVRFSRMVVGWAMGPKDDGR